MRLHSLLVLPGILCIVNGVLAEICFSDDTCKVNSGENIFMECKAKEPVYWEYPWRTVIEPRAVIEEDYEEQDAFTHATHTRIHASEGWVQGEDGFYTTNLTITSATYDLTGFYKCLQENKHVVKEKYYFIVDDKKLLVHEDLGVFSAYFLMEAIIECKPTDPDIKVSLTKWGGRIIRTGIHDGRNITYDPRYGYIINPVYLSDAGDYNCTAEKGHSQSITYHLHLEEYTDIKPMINESIWVPYVREGGDLVMVCSLTALPIEFNWRTPQDPEDTRLSITKKYFPDKMCSILRVHNVSLSDSGLYECAAKYEDSSYSTNKTIFVLGDTFKVISGEDFFLECKDKKPVHWEYPRQDFLLLSNEDQGIRAQDEYMDIPDNLEVHSSKGWAPDENGFYTAGLRITNAMYTDTGFYKCLHRSKHVVKEKYYFIADDKELLVHVDLAKFHGYLLRPAVIPCKPTDWDVKVSLKKAKGSIIHTGIHEGKTITYDPRHGYTIDRVFKSDAGVYICTATKGHIQTRTYVLNIQEEKAPFLKSSNLNVKEQEVSPGLPIMLYCQFGGIPSPQILWIKDEKQINATHRIQLKNKNETLNITVFQKEDEGNYTCFAMNQIGKLSKSIILVEQGKLGIPKSFTAGIIICSIVVIMLLVVLSVRIHKERKLRKKLALAGLANFVKGMPECINPDLPVDEQADLLPYDKKWEFPRERLWLGKQLGAGAFGVVLKAEAQGILTGQEWKTVAVKMAKSGMADRTYLHALASELKIMSHLGQHLNVVNLLGACTKNLARRMELLVIVEYCRYGNLHNYLLRRRDNFVNQVDPDTGEVNLALGQEKLACTPIRLFTRSKSLLKQRLFSFTSNSAQSSAPSSPGPLGSGEDSSGYLVEADECLLSSSSSEQPDWRVRYGGDYKGTQTGPICTQDLICWGFQVARGMEYLASRKVLHGDLAARNLLLADNNVVKICDFGLAKSMYKTDNYRKKGAGPLPIKWMAPESISDRVFSTQSDVWSFGIVLWELFSLAQTPYPGMAADENLYRKLQGGYRMEQPPNATNAIYSVMLRCWERYPDKRPSFSEIADLLGATLDGNVRRHFEELNDPYIVMNKNYQEGEDYLKMMSAPDYTNMTVKEQDDYVNSPGSTSQAQDYLQMIGNPKDIFSPRLSNEVFEFPSDYLSMSAKQPQDNDIEEKSQTERKTSSSKYVNIEDKGTAVSNPNYR